MTLTPKHKMLSKNADLLTPISIFQKLTGEKKFLLESSSLHETKGKFSFIGANPIQEIIGNGSETEVFDLHDMAQTVFPLNTLDYLKTTFPKFDLPIPFPFTGGAVGYVAYDMIRQFVAVGKELEDELNIPDAHFMIYDTIIVFEHRTETIHIIAFGFNGESEAALHERIIAIETELDQPNSMKSATEVNVIFKPKIQKDQFIKQVQLAKELLAKENMEQIVVSQRMVAELNVDPFSFYRQLRAANPSPYMFFIDFNDYYVVGASPESLVKTTKDTVITNPIAGTRKRGGTAEEDDALQTELLQDEKELMEHEMLVTLSEQELAPLCKQNSITVPINKQVEKFEHVMHLVSEVHGKLKNDVSSIDALIACLPAGTVSGSPKERAVKIINDIEEERRGFYAGGVGYITWNHDINFAIAIRSLVVKDKKAYLQTGAGIVAQSIPENEYEETLHKARSLTNLKKSRQMS